MLLINQLGRFPITSNRGNEYIVIFYIYNANFVESVPIKSRPKDELLQSYWLVYAYLTARGFKPQLHKMDNKMSHDVKTFIHEENTRLQYTPLNIHCTNPAEWAFCTWKNHFLSSIAPKTFPIANWCCLTDQTDFTLNMLWPCHKNPALSAFKALEGSYSFDATPMALLGTNVLAHHKPNQRPSWGFHALSAWYISHSLQHYRCTKVIMRNTGGKCITDTFRYKHHAIPIPKVTATDCILEATHRLTTAIEGVQEAALSHCAISSLANEFPNSHAHHLPHRCMTLRLTRNQSICGIQLSALSPSCPPMQPQRRHRLDVSSSTMMTPHIPAVYTGSPTIIDDNDNAPLMVKHSRTQAQLCT
jgi:hypothetical protein